MSVISKLPLAIQSRRTHWRFFHRRRLSAEAARLPSHALCRSSLSAGIPSLRRRSPGSFPTTIQASDPYPLDQTVAHINRKACSVWPIITQTSSSFPHGLAIHEQWVFLKDTLLLEFGGWFGGNNKSKLHTCLLPHFVHFLT